jgi:hypothetical protein
VFLGGVAVPGNVRRNWWLIERMTQTVFVRGCGVKEYVRVFRHARTGKIKGDARHGSKNTRNVGMWKEHLLGWETIGGCWYGMRDRS